MLDLKGRFGNGTRLGGEMSESSENEDHRLSDEDYLQFLTRGYVALPSSLSPDYHDARYQEADVLYGRLHATQARRGNVEK